MTDDSITGGLAAPRPGAPGGDPAPVAENTLFKERRAAPVAGDGMRPLAVFSGSGWALLKIHLCNYLFTLLTLGVYSFWGKARVRRYLWENTAVLGESLEYTGTGGELFKSFLAVMLLGLLGMSASYVLSLLFPFAAPLALAAVLLPVGHFAAYQALRYRLTRTRWRGIRGNMDGGAAKYAVTGSAYTLLALATLFVCRPLETARLTGKRLNASFFGNRRVAFSGPAKTLFASWLKSYLLLALLFTGTGLIVYGAAIDTTLDLEETNRLLGLAVFALVAGLATLAGLFAIIYTAAVVRWLFANLTFGRMRFDAGGYSAWGLFRLKFVNGILLLFTLGIAYPWTEIRSLRFFLSAIRYAGDPELEKLLQDTLPEKARGEGLLDALDMDLAI